MKKEVRIQTRIAIKIGMIRVTSLNKYCRLRVAFYIKYPFEYISRLRMNGVEGVQNELQNNPRTFYLILVTGVQNFIIAQLDPISTKETPQRTEVQASGVRGLSLGIDQDTSRDYRSRDNEYQRIYLHRLCQGMFWKETQVGLVA